MVAREALELLDERLAGLSRAEGALRLRLGQLLEGLGASGGHAELGFLRFSSYVAERCERGVRWAQGARALARRLESLPRSKGALARGELSWSQAELLSMIATPVDELHWLSLAERLTVRQLGAVVRGVAASGKSDPEDGNALPAANDERRELSVSLNQEDFWILQATRALMALRLDTVTEEDQGYALLAEATTTLQGRHPGFCVDLDEPDPAAAEAAWRAELAAWQAEAEERCEGRIPLGPPAERGRDDELEQAVMAGLPALAGKAPNEVDAAIGEVSRRLAALDLELARALCEFHRADGWRKLGYASARQYAHERLGTSRSLMYARLALARRLERLPLLAGALERGELGVEAAVQLLRVVTPATEVGWVERARRRTIKVLREEVAAASAARRVSGKPDCPPPMDDELEAYFALERAVVSGAVLCGPALRGSALRGSALRGSALRGSASGGSASGGSASGGSASGGSMPEATASRGTAPGEAGPGIVQVTAPIWSATPAAGPAKGVQVSAPAAVPEGREPWRTALASLGAWLARGIEQAASPVRRGAALRGAGRVSVRLRLRAADHDYWRRLERAWRRVTTGPGSFLKAACLCFWESWRHILGGDALFARDRGRCACPVCEGPAENRHHLRFRSRGGGDEDSNLLMTCFPCHVPGIHEGRLSAEGTAGHVRWMIGRQPLMVVEGRERILL